jgi:hypothetical protein
MHEIQDNAILLREDLALLINPVGLAARAHEEHEHGENSEDKTKTEEKKPHNWTLSQARPGHSRNAGNVMNFRCFRRGHDGTRAGTMPSTAPFKKLTQPAALVANLFPGKGWSAAHQAFLLKAQPQVPAVPPPAWA